MIGSYTLLLDQNKIKVKKKNIEKPAFFQGALYVHELFGFFCFSRYALKSRLRLSKLNLCLRHLICIKYLPL